MDSRRAPGSYTSREQLRRARSASVRFEASRKSMAALVMAMGMLPSIGRPADLPQMPQPLENVVLPAKPPAAHWVWLGDFQNGLYARSVLYDADRGAILGMIDTGWEGIK